MRRSIYLALVVVLLAACKSETKKTFEITGQVQNGSAKKIYLEESPLGASQGMLVDSASINTNGAFHLKTTTREQSLYYLYFDDPGNVFGFVINDGESVKMNVDLQKKDYTVEGSKATNELKKFLEQAGEQWNELNKIGTQMNALQQSPGADSMFVALNQMAETKVAALKDFVRDYIHRTQSPVAATFAFQRYVGLFSLSENEKLMDEIANRFTDHKGVSSAKEVNDRRLASMKPWVGKDAPEIALPDTKGNPVTLSSYRGKYVLVDFWASWCGPCRRENPNVVKAFNQFKDKNFSILGVSLDSSKNDWLEAIREDGLSWTHVSDLKLWGNEAAKTYRVQGIPFNVLVDPSGKIIAQDLRGEELDEKLAQVLK